MTATGFKFPIYNSDGSTNSTVDVDDMFVPMNMFDGNVMWCWGIENVTNGTFGVGGGARTVPTVFGSLDAWSYVDIGKSISITSVPHAIKYDGTLWGWGYNQYGTIGNGTSTRYSSPVQVGSLNTWKKVASGGVNLVAAIATNGTLWSWGSIQGSAFSGQTNIPGQIGSDTNWSDLECFQGCMSMLKTDGTLWALAYTPNVGEVGNGTVGITYTSPVQIGSDTTWKKITRGNNTAAGIKADGSLWMWGDNSLGQYGNGTTNDASTPIQVGSGFIWTNVEISSQSTYAIKNNGTLWAWGYNNVGQLGNGNIITYSSPIQVGNLTTWKSIASTYSSFIATSTDGSIWSSGSVYGLGPTIINYSSPVQVGSLTGWNKIRGGFSGVFATKYSTVY